MLTTTSGSMDFPGKSDTLSGVIERVFERMKRYSEEFRDESVRLVLESERSVAEVAWRAGDCV